MKRNDIRSEHTANHYLSQAAALGLSQCTGKAKAEPASWLFGGFWRAYFWLLLIAAALFAGSFYL